MATISSSSISSNDDDASVVLQRNLPYLKHLVNMDKLMPQLMECHIQGLLHKGKLNNTEISNGERVTLLTETLSQCSGDEWWEQLLTCLRAINNGRAELAVRILEVGKHLVRIFIHYIKQTSPLMDAYSVEMYA